MRWISAAVLAFSTYSRIPMPKVRFDGADKLALVLLPLVGAALGGTLCLWQLLCRGLGLSPVFFAAVAAVLPLLVTGGIHMDGYCDTADALASRQDKARALEILKDPHLGAFALIRFGVYLLVHFALLYELALRGSEAGLAFLYFLSRCFTAGSALFLPKARKVGMLAAFTDKGDDRTAVLVLALLSAAGLAGWTVFTFPRGLAGLVLCLPLTLWYRGMTLKRFGGVTGDTTGYYLQTTELALLAGLLIGGVAAQWL